MNEPTEQKGLFEQLESYLCVAPRALEIIAEFEQRLADCEGNEVDLNAVGDALRDVEYLGSYADGILLLKQRLAEAENTIEDLRLIEREKTNQLIAANFELSDAREHIGQLRIQRERSDKYIGDLLEENKKLSDQLASAHQATRDQTNTACETLGQLDQVYSAFGIGSKARTISCLMTNLSNVQRRAQCLHTVEREFFMVPAEPSDEPGDEGLDPGEDCLLNWGADPDEYVEQFRAALKTIAPVEALAELERVRALAVKANEFMRNALILDDHGGDDFESECADCRLVQTIVQMCTAAPQQEPPQ